MTDQLSVADQRRRQASWRALKEMLDAAETHLPPNSSTIRALDLGCGTGEVMRLMMDFVMGVDQDDAMLAVASARINSCSGTSTKLVKHNVCTLTPEMIKQPVHFIWTSFTVQYFMASLPETLKVWERLLLPGGLVAILETDGLFSVHEPCVSQEAWRCMDDELLNEHGYDCFAGRKVAQMLKDSSIFDFVDTEWEDPEFAFDGPSSPKVCKLGKDVLIECTFHENTLAMIMHSGQKSFSIACGRRIIGRRRNCGSL